MSVTWTHDEANTKYKMPITRWNTNYKIHVATTTTQTDAQIQIEIWMQPWGLVWVTCRKDETQAPLLVIIKHQPASSSGENGKGSQTNIPFLWLFTPTPSSRDEKKKKLDNKCPSFLLKGTHFVCNWKTSYNLFLGLDTFVVLSCFLHFQLPCLAPIRSFAPKSYFIVLGFHIFMLRRRQKKEVVWKG